MNTQRSHRGSESFTLDDGSTYKGEIEDGTAHGRGTQTASDVSISEGASSSTARTTAADITQNPCGCAVFDPGNLVTVCRDCHYEVHNELLMISSLSRPTA